MMDWAQSVMLKSYSGDKLNIVAHLPITRHREITRDHFGHGFDTNECT